MISIIVPVYNVEKYLAKCLDSLIHQTYKDIEMILVNDGSKDQSLAICESYQQKDQRIKVVSKENGGLSSARNYGMKFIQGDYVFFVDSDDYIKEKTIETMVFAALKHQADLVVCDMEYLYDDGHVEFASGGDFVEGNYQENHELIFINNSACNKLIHKDLLEGFSFPEGLWYEDLGSMPILVAKAKHMVKVNEAFYVYYQRSGSIAHSSSEKVFDIYKAIALVEKQVDINVKSFYIIHGLDLTTLRIKDFDKYFIKETFLEENMTLLRKYYPNWKKDPYLKTYSLKKRIIFKLLDLGRYSMVLDIYDRGKKI